MEKPTYRKITETAPITEWCGKTTHFYTKGVNPLLKKHGIMKKFNDKSVTLFEVGVGLIGHHKKPGVAHVLKEFNPKIKEAFVFEPDKDCFENAESFLKNLKRYKFASQTQDHPNLKPLTLQKKQPRQVNLVQANLFSSLPSRRADITLCCLVISNFPKPNERHALFYNLLLATKPGGYLIVDNECMKRTSDRQSLKKLNKHGLKLVGEILLSPNRGVESALMFRKPRDETFDEKIFDIIKKMGKDK